ncbi:ABC-type multidrug transport system, ATPase component [Methylophaga frappieri]|uniref:ABC-type multidrug transport system, ATPase component n=1 Tax=Methylophaga frappieri (strain ATCC BAA-2434 / DSM 25690 / JAM7) TaxID=754477 RepID=I1YHE8_METFJ|nr:ATP-binding cassette domain-containing protein [Methylophaga frappieri]AFJ02341.1 ABC-type multidrug transport system, ATPase component [Methylophaga frappieri]
MSEARCLLKTEKLTRQFSGKLAVNALSFEVYQGEVLGFLGPNGAGKSTTMNMLTGNLSPDSGMVEINGIDLFDQPESAKQHLGYLPENPPLYRELTVREFLQFCGQIHGVNRKHLTTRIDDTLEQCGLATVSNRLIGQLSKGYQQRTGIAQAILHQPAVVILDEPTSGLDPIQIQQIRQLIRHIADQHSVIVSTHILQEVEMLCDRVQIMRQGKLVFSDSLVNLQSLRQQGAIKVRFHSPPDTMTLANLAGVTAVENLGEGYFRLQFLPDHNPTDKLVRQSVSEDWRLMQLIPELDSLEQLFTQLVNQETNGDDS